MTNLQRNEKIRKEISSSEELGLNDRLTDDIVSVKIYMEGHDL